MSNNQAKISLFEADNLYKLEELYLANNCIENIWIKFEDLTRAKLKTLDISHNKLTKISEDLYPNLVSLE